MMLGFGQSGSQPEKTPPTGGEIAAVILLVLGIIGGGFAAIFVLAALRAWVITVMWGWYLVPGLGLPPITLPVAFGVSLLITYLVRRDEGAKEKKKAPEIIAEALLMPFMVLLVGWIGTWFM